MTLTMPTLLASNCLTYSNIQVTNKDVLKPQVTIQNYMTSPFCVGSFQHSVKKEDNWTKPATWSKVNFKI
jgi:hypothetical protein